MKAGYTDAGETKTVTFEVLLNGIDSAEGTLKLLSTRGGYSEHLFLKNRSKAIPILLV